MVKGNYIVEIPERMAKKIINLHKKQVEEGNAYERDFNQLIIECVEIAIYIHENPELIKETMKIFIRNLLSVTNNDIR